MVAVALMIVGAVLVAVGVGVVHGVGYGLIVGGAASALLGYDLAKKGPPAGSATDDDRARDEEFRDGAPVVVP